jgi:hypothetical protein
VSPYQLGYDDGLGGENRNPYPADSAMYLEYQRGYTDGDEDYRHQRAVARRKEQS